jgi:hypothetical protein
MEYEDWRTKYTFLPPIVSFVMVYALVCTMALLVFPSSANSAAVNEQEVLFPLKVFITDLLLA